MSVMQYDDFYDRITYPGKETVFRQGGKRETLSFSCEQPLPPPDWRQGQQVGDFVLDSVLGAGVTSSVYQVVEVSTQRLLALKLLRVRNPECLAASRLGYRRIMRVSHPSLVKIFGIHQIEGMAAIAMESVAGVSLSSLIRSLAGDRDSAFQYASRLASDIGGALHTIHGAGLVHRDIKPDNLMVEPSGRIRLIDYGLVGSFDPQGDPDARRGYLAGSFWYMAPESICSQIYPPACDIYALGCVLLELIADPSRLPEPQAGKSLGESVGDIDRVIPSDTPENLRDMIREMLHCETEHRPMAIYVARVGQSQADHPVDCQAAFPPIELLGRDDEMRQAETWFHATARNRSGWLHLSGPKGSGKTWFASELQKRLGSVRWFQVFDTTCFEQGQNGFSLFEDFADSVARRYARDDRAMIQLSSAATTTLLWLFPTLRSIVNEDSSASESESDCTPQPLDTESDSESSVFAAMVELLNSICEYGPVLLIVDNFQWIDRDSVNLLEQLLANTKGPLGVMTISESASTPLAAQPDQTLVLRPLDQAQSVCLINNLLGHQVARHNHATVEQIARRSSGDATQISQSVWDLLAEKTL